MIVVRIHVSDGEYDVKKEPWAGGQVPGSCLGSATDLLCDLGQILFPLCP